jgi:hypothetical protein
MKNSHGTSFRREPLAECCFRFSKSVSGSNVSIWCIFDILLSKISAANPLRPPSQRAKLRSLRLGHIIAIPSCPSEWHSVDKAYRSCGRARYTTGFRVLQRYISPTLSTLSHLPDGRQLQGLKICGVVHFGISSRSHIKECPKCRERHAPCLHYDPNVVERVLVRRIRKKPLDRAAVVETTSHSKRTVYVMRIVPNDVNDLNP